MIRVQLSASPAEFEHDGAVAGALGRHLCCDAASGNEYSELPRLHLTPQRLPEPFRVFPDHGVVVSTWESAPISAYTGLQRDRYLLIASLLALSQWRVLRRNPLLQLEDLRHPPGVRCVFAEPNSVQDFALLLDPPVICPGCADFYHCLGADSELVALRETIAEAQTAGANAPLAS